jgi:hypothetical protein
MPKVIGNTMTKVTQAFPEQKIPHKTGFFDAWKTAHGRDRARLTRDAFTSLWKRRLFSTAR